MGVMTKKLGLVTADPEVLGDARDEELPLLLDALAAAGVEVDAPIWNDPNDWAAYDLLVIRSPWDYAERPDDFLDWLNDVGQQARILNNAALIRWNYDKRYAEDLVARGVPCVRSAFCRTVDEAKAALASHRHHNVVVKPAISAGVRDTGLYAADDPHAVALAELILSDGKNVIVQPAVGTVHELGELSLIYFAGEFSHAIKRGAILKQGGGFKEGHFSMPAEPATASDEMLGIGETALRAIEKVQLDHGIDAAPATPLYARFDIIRSDHAHARVLEADVFEPHLYLSHAPGAVDRFVGAILAELNR